jgi:hypothetical protein
VEPCGSTATCIREHGQIPIAYSWYLFVSFVLITGRVTELVGRERGRGRERERKRERERESAHSVLRE